MIQKLLRHLLPRVQCASLNPGPSARKKSSVLLSLASVYLWDEEGISRNDFNHTIREFWRMYRSHRMTDFAASQKLPGPRPGLVPDSNNNSTADDDTEFPDDDECENEWEAIIVKEHLQVYRKLVTGSSYLYQYRIFGTYDDIPAKAFFLVQLDTTFRKVWDKLVIKLDVVDSESKSMKRNPDYEAIIDKNNGHNFDTKNQVVHWVMHYPYPMYCREYCYVRRAVIDRRKNLMILVSKSTSHPSCGQSNDYVRVSDYDSRMVIRPHKSLHDNGFDYLLTYFDDPQSSFPSAAYNWMAYSGVPDFVNKLHAAAVRLNNETISQRRNAVSNNSHPAEENTDREERTQESEPSVRKPEATSSSASKLESVTRTSVRSSPAANTTPAPSSKSIRVESGHHSVFHGWSTFFSR